MNDDLKIKMFHRVIGSFRRLVKLSQEFDEKPRDFGTGEKIYSSEIHLIEAIGDSSGMSVTEASDLLGVTKGAISQTLKKLEVKELIIKNQDPSNASKYVLELSNKGKSAYYAHMHWHEKIDGGFRETFYAVDVEKLQFMHDFIKVFESFLTARLDEDS